jgi:hypothetical protein
MRNRGGDVCDVACFVLVDEDDVDGSSSGAREREGEGWRASDAGEADECADTPLVTAASAIAAEGCAGVGGEGRSDGGGEMMRREVNSTLERAPTS